MKLSSAIYTAYRGYAWSNEVDGVSKGALDRLYRFISEARGAFPDPLTVEVGLVSDGKTVGAFTIQNVDKWDSEGRACDYAPFVFFPVGQASGIDFIDLLNNDFFWTPSRKPQNAFEYVGGPSEKVVPMSVRSLLTTHQCLLANPRCIGDLLARYGARSARWVCRMREGNVMTVECDRWN